MTDDVLFTPTEFRDDADIETGGSNVPRIGCHNVPTPNGPVHFCEVPGLMLSTIHANGADQPATSVALMVFRGPLPGQSLGNGFILQADGSGARDIAMALLKMADEIDPNKVN